MAGQVQLRASGTGIDVVPAVGVRWLSRCSLNLGDYRGLDHCGAQPPANAAGQDDKRRCERGFPVRDYVTGAVVGHVGRELARVFMGEQQGEQRPEEEPGHENAGDKDAQGGSGWNGSHE